MTSSKSRQATKSVPVVHAVMDPEEICADLEKLYVSRTNKENQYVNTTTQVNNNRQSQAFFCGVDPGTTSSIFHQLYKVGASSISRPPRKIGKQEPDNADNVPPSLPMRLCGMDRSTTSTDIFTGIFATGVEAVAETQDQSWNPHETEGSLEMLLQKQKAQNKHELRVVKIAEDLKKEAPDLIKRENLLPMMKQTQERNRERRLQQRKGYKAEHSGQARETDSKRPTVTFKFDEESDSEGYPSDIDEFLEFARIVVEEQNTSFEMTSYREFEKALQEAINTHFLEDDDDSMTSMSSYSGVNTETKNFEKNNFESKLGPTTGTDSTNTRKLTMVPKISMNHATGCVKVDTALLVNKAAALKKVTADSIPGTTKVHNGESSQKTAHDTSRSFSHRVPVMIGKQKSSKQNSEVDDSILNLTEMMSASTASQINSNLLVSQDSSVASNHSMNSSSAPMASDIDGSSAVSGASFTHGSPLVVMRRQIERENCEIDKFQFDPLNNSLLSETSFRADSKIKKLRFRKKVPPRSNNITPSPDHSESETPHGTLTEGMKRTVENLAYLLSEVDNNPTRKKKGVDRDVVLQKLHDVAPHLYKAVLARMGSEYAKHDVNQQTAAPFARRGTIGVEKTRKPVPSNKFHKGNPTGAFDASKHSAAKRAPNYIKNTSFSDSKPPLSPLKASPPITKVNPEEALEAASLGLDISRGSFWSDVLNVNEGPTPDTGGDLDSSVDLPSISFDAHESISPSLQQEQTSSPSKQGEENNLDTMVEDFLLTKIDRLNSLMLERQIILSQMERVFAELKRTPASLLRKSGFADRYRLVRSLSNGYNSFPRVERGRALIRKIQRKRQAMTLARQQENENIPCSAHIHIKATSVTQAIQTHETHNSRVQREEYTPGDSRQHAIDEEFQFDDFLTTSHEDKASNSSPSDTTRNTIRQVGEKRKMILKKLGRSMIPVYKKALHESMDSALETDDAVCTGSTGTRMISPSPKQPSVITIRKKQKHKDCNYKPLPDQNFSFNCFQEMSGDDFWNALAPPSPESPIHGYRIDTKSLALTDDIAGLFEVASGDWSGDEGRVLVFSDTEASSHSENLRSISVTDDFDTIVGQSSTTFESFWDVEDAPVKIHKKDSPISIADFLDEADGVHENKVAAAYERVRTANYLDEDDQFIHTTMDLFMLSDDDEEEDIFDWAEFYSTTRFMI